MPSHEQLYHDLQEKEREDDFRYRQNRAPDALRSFTPKPVDYVAAMKRYTEEFAPVFAARRKVAKSKVFREKMRQSGDLKDMELDPKQIVDPTKGLVSIGPTAEEIAKQIAKNPKAFRHLRKMGIPVQKVNAKHRVIEPRLGGPRDDS